MSAPSGYTALDFVGFTDKGTYSPIVKYMRNDLVHYGGNIMRCKVDDTMNVTPVEGANWELWVGASANLVERVIAPLENNPADVAFGVGRQIIYDDWLWEVIAPIEVGDALIDYAVDPTNANIKKSAPVETQLLAVKAEADATDNMIAPTEANASSSSAAYSVGAQLILNKILYDVVAAIQIGDALTTGTGGNIAAADTLTDQLNAKANSSDLAAVATSGSYNDLSNKPTLGTAAAKGSTNAVTSGSTDLVESGAVYTEIQTLKKRHIILCGDSYVQGVGGNGTTLESVMESITNWDVRRYYAGGCGYLRANTSNKKMLDVVQDAVDDLTDSEKKTVTDIVLAASAYNDTGMSSDPSFTESSFVSAIENINTLIKTNFPNARVTVVPALWVEKTYNSVFKKVFEWTISGAKSIGANYSSRSLMWLQPYDNSVDSGDNVHPSALGYNIIGKNIASVINGKEPAIYSGHEVVTTATNDTIGITYLEDHVHITGTITKEEGQTFSSLFNVPQPLKKLVNYPVPYIRYGDRDLQAFLITGSTTYLASDWLTVGSQYIIRADVPYVE